MVRLLASLRPPRLRERVGIAGDIPRSRTRTRQAARAGAAIAVAALALGACDKPVAEGKPGELRVVAGEHGFAPAALAVPRGGPGSKATITFVRTTDKTCATEVVFPAIEVKRDLPLNQPVAVDVPTDEAHTLTFQCGMGMYKGALVVN